MHLENGRGLKEIAARGRYSPLFVLKNNKLTASRALTYM